MIHFNFLVSEEDAENIIDFVNDTITNANMEVMNLITLKGADHPETKWMKRYVAYCKELKSKMKNYKVDHWS